MSTLHICQVLSENKTATYTIKRYREHYYVEYYKFLYTSICIYYLIENIQFKQVDKEAHPVESKR